MSDREFRLFSHLIYSQCGVNLLPVKKTMLRSRLMKRLRSLGMNSFGDYFDYVTSAGGRAHELVQMIDVVTTNKTEFFRESNHFDILKQRVLPERIQSSQGKIKVWSAGCSSGEEPYSLGMVLADFCGGCKIDAFAILASDISSRVLKIAREGIYPESIGKSIAPAMKQKYMMRGKGARSGFMRVVPELRRNIEFRRLNLVQEEHFGLKRKFDIIFCRNVIIYFDRPTQIKLFEKFYEQLVPGGYLFIGHSETLNGISNRFRSQGGSVYRKPDKNL